MNKLGTTPTANRGSRTNILQHYFTSTIDQIITGSIRAVAWARITGWLGC